VALNQDRQTHIVQDRHQPGVCLTEPQGAAGSLEPQMVGQEHADGLRVQVPDAFKVDDNVPRPRLME
jgi:hypothetical protein